LVRVWNTDVETAFKPNSTFTHANFLLQAFSGRTEMRQYPASPTEGKAEPAGEDDTDDDASASRLATHSMPLSVTDTTRGEESWARASLEPGIVSEYTMLTRGRVSRKWPM
jgi:hypothetical protein